MRGLTLAVVLVAGCRPAGAAATSAAEPAVKRRTPAEAPQFYTSPEAPFRIRLPPGKTPPQVATEGDRRVLMVAFEHAFLTLTYWQRNDDEPPSQEGVDRYADAVLAAGGFMTETGPESVIVPGARIARRTGIAHSAGLQGIFLVAVRDPWVFALFIAAEPTSPFLPHMDPVAESLQLIDPPREAFTQLAPKQGTCPQ